MTTKRVYALQSIRANVAWAPRPSAALESAPAWRLARAVPPALSRSALRQARQNGVSVTLRKNHTLSQTILYGLRIAFIHRRSRNRQSMTSRNRKLVSNGNLWPGGIF